MDDRNFNELDATEWIRIVESDASLIRENDLYPLLKAWIKENNPEKILDVGCGQGICSTVIEKSCSYVGVDPSSFLIRRAKDLYSSKNREFVIGNVYTLPFENGAFDLVFSIAMLHLIENLTEAVKEISRVLRPGGSFLIVTADPDFYEAWTVRYQQQNIDGIRFVGTNVLDGKAHTDVLYLRSKSEIFETFKSVGLEITGTDCFRNQLALKGKNL